MQVIIKSENTLKMTSKLVSLTSSFRKRFSQSALDPVKDFLDNVEHDIDNQTMGDADAINDSDPSSSLTDDTNLVASVLDASAKSWKALKSLTAANSNEDPTWKQKVELGILQILSLYVCI